MADVTITSDQLGSAWTIRNAAADPVTGELDVYNAAIAVGAQVGIWYGDKIKALSAEIVPDTEQIASLQAAMQALQGKTPYTLADLAGPIAVAIEVMRANGTDGNSQCVRWNYTPVTGGADGGTMPYDSLVDTGMPFPADSTGLGEGTIYRATDGRMFVFREFTGVIEVKAYMYVDGDGLTDDVLSSWKKALQDSAEKLTQITQGKQAFLQELIASMSKYLSFATSIVQRNERNRLDIIGRF